MQQLKGLDRKLQRSGVDSGDIALWSVEARDETDLNGIIAASENDRNSRGRLLGGHRRRIAACHDHRWPFVDQISSKLGKPIELVLGPTIFDRNIPPLDIIGLLQALLERGHKELIVVRRRAAQKPDRRQRWLLRACTERPCCRCASECCDKVASPHGLALRPTAVPYHLVARCASQQVRPPI